MLTCVDTSNLVVKKIFIALKAKTDKLYIDKLVHVPAGLIDLKTTINDLDVDKLKYVPIDFKN